jgi:hypothetical protein
VTADKNPEYDTAPGNDTEDQVFLLSIPEVEKYFKTGEERRCEPTEYALITHSSSDNTNFKWWLRSPGSDGDSAAVVLNTNAIHFWVDTYDIGVRPALWVDLES